MPTTSVYGITYPASTDLVTDGASQMGTISTGFDTAIQKAVSTNDGRNWVDNPEFEINYRNSQTITASTTGYIADRWIWQVASATATFTRSTISLGTTGLDSSLTRGATVQTTVSSLAAASVYFQQLIDAVERLANRTVILSFYAKAATGTPNIGARLVQNFGTGGAPSAEVAQTLQTKVLSTSWVRYSMTFTLPSVSGKTLGTNNDDATRIEIWTSGGSGSAGSAVGHQLNTIDITGIQLETDYLTNYELRYDWVDVGRCSRFFQTSYQDSIWLLAGGAGAASAIGKIQISGATNGSGVMYYPHKFAVIMQRVPTMRFYTQSTGVVGSWDYARSAASGTQTVSTSTPSGLAANGFLLVNTASLGALWTPAEIQGHWTASIDGW